MQYYLRLQVQLFLALNHNIDDDINDELGSPISKKFAILINYNNLQITTYIKCYGHTIWLKL